MSVERPCHTLPMTEATVPAPLFRDPVHDGAADPTLIMNRDEGTWWMIYTNRRADAPSLPGVAWVHGTDLGVASTHDGGLTWLYRGIVPGLRLGWEAETFWAPEVIFAADGYQLYLTVIIGIPDRWDGHPRRIRHYVSADLVQWTYVSTLTLSSERVIDACVHELPGGGFRLWYKDEDDGNLTWYADSTDLDSWTVGGRAFDGPPHEGPNVFALAGSYWMIVDEWRGQRVLRSDDLTTWEAQGLILDAPGRRPEDGQNALHADVVVDGDLAHVFYFTHPGRDGNRQADESVPSGRRTSIQAARLRFEGGTLVCDRDEVLTAPILPMGGQPTR